MTPKERKVGARRSYAESRKIRKTVSYPLRVPQELLELARMRAEEERVDQSTSIRQLIYLGAEEWLLQLVAAGRISVGRAAELLGVTVYDIHRLAEKHGLRLGARGEQIKKAEKAAARLFKAR